MAPELCHTEYCLPVLVRAVQYTVCARLLAQSCAGNIAFLFSIDKSIAMLLALQTAAAVSVGVDTQPSQSWQVLTFLVT